MRCLGTAGRYAETVGSPSTQNRHGTSAAAEIPTRGPLRIFLSTERAVVLASGQRMRSGESGTQTSAPSSDRSMSSAWHSRAGPRARSRKGIIVVPRVRRERASSSPSMIRPARSRTADALPLPRQTRLTQKCMPYVKYT